MAEADLSKIVNLIMENPTLIEEIRSMAKKSDATEEKSLVAEENEVENKEAEPTIIKEEIKKAEGTPRKELLCALKPYVSSERAHAIDTMLSIIDILDMMKR